MKSINVISFAALAVLSIVSFYSVEEVRGEGSFSKQIETINQEVEKWYQKTTKAVKKMKLFNCVSTEANLQSVESHWPRQLMKVLQVATGVSSSSKVDMTEVSRLLTGIRHNDKRIEEEFGSNLAKFLLARWELEMEFNISFNEKSDVFILVENIKNELCGPFQPESGKYFDFKGAVNDLIKMAMVNNDQFLEQVVRSNKPIAPLYSAAMICRLIVEGLSEENNQFKVDVTSNNNHRINDWPYDD